MRGGQGTTGSFSGARGPGRNSCVWAGSGGCPRAPAPSGVHVCTHAPQADPQGTQPKYPLAADPDGLCKGTEPVPACEGSVCTTPAPPPHRAGGGRGHHQKWVLAGCARRPVPGRAENPALRHLLDTGEGRGLHAQRAQEVPEPQGPGLTHTPRGKPSPCAAPLCTWPGAPAQAGRNRPPCEPGRACRAPRAKPPEVSLMRSAHTTPSCKPGGQFHVPGRSPGVLPTARPLPTTLVHHALL